mmetsp:Transcript_37368/g.68655  ORF Transcript_37368/g.68655 Transcript_37368/m.68655 type:complete len:745 (+) Transcript_37368:132-2366(+)
MVRKNNNNDKGGTPPSYPPELTIPAARRPRERHLLSQSIQSSATAHSQPSQSSRTSSRIPVVSEEQQQRRAQRRASRRLSVDTVRATNTGTGARTEGNDVRTVEVEMQVMQLPPDHNDDEDAKEEEEEDQQQRTRVRRRQRDRRQRDRNDFRTSISTINTNMSHLIASNDEDPTFWGVSNRWFSDAGEFVGELTGMATMRLPDDDDVFPRTEGVEIVSAADDGADDDVDVDDDDDDEENFLTYSDTISTPFDELSSMGDTTTGIFTETTRRNVVRGASWILLSLMMVGIAIQVAVNSSSWFHVWSSGNRVSVFARKRSRRYAKLKAKLIKLSGKEVFSDEESPQHKALMYLADGDSLSLDPHDSTVLTQFYQRYALAVFYFSTGGPNWKSRTYWLTGRHECGWLFVICSDIAKENSVNDNNRDSNNTEDDDYSNFLDSDLGLGDGKVVTGLSLYGQGLLGTIPKEIETLEFLHVLDLGNNKLNGIIGTEFGRLQHLRKLYLENNMLKGGVEAVPWLSSLKRVNVENNQLSGTLPYELGKLKHLEEVRMGRNQIHGKIPSSLLRSQTLTKLDLHGNELTGELTIHEASILKYLYLYDNKLSGQLSPSDLCSVSKSLIDLRLNNNSFVGKIPNIDCTMEQLELLSLAQNELTGPIYDTLGKQIPRIRELHLYENRLLSTIPESIFRPENLTAVLLGNNELTGSLTASMLNDAHNLAHFYVNSNKLSGKLDDFAKPNLASLKKLRLE